MKYAVKWRPCTDCYGNVVYPEYEAQYAHPEDAPAYECATFKFMEEWNVPCHETTLAVFTVGDGT